MKVKGKCNSYSQPSISSEERHKKKVPICRCDCTQPNTNTCSFKEVKMHRKLTSMLEMEILEKNEQGKKEKNIKEKHKNQALTQTPEISSLSCSYYNSVNMYQNANVF